MAKIMPGGVAGLQWRPLPNAEAPTDAAAETRALYARNGGCIKEKLSPRTAAPAWTVDKF